LKPKYSLLPPTIKHQEPFKSIAKSTIDVSLMTTAASLEDFCDILKRFHNQQRFQCRDDQNNLSPSESQWQAMEMASFNNYKITEIKAEITSLKSKTDLLVGTSHLP
jgi:hypothetical protein